MRCFGLPTTAPDGNLSGMIHPMENVYNRFCKWRDDGTLVRIFQALNKDVDMQNLSLDYTVIQVHSHSAGAEKGL